jgi:hypothetical protein
MAGVLIVPSLIARSRLPSGLVTATWDNDPITYTLSAKNANFS